MDLLELVDEDHRRIAMNGDIARGDLHLQRGIAVANPP
jgi:hypothetical protein